MVARITKNGRVLLRRSTSMQEKSLEFQLDWAISRARELGVVVNASRVDLHYAQQHGLHRYNDIYVDDAVTGSDLRRPGLTAFLQDVKRDHTVSHVFVYLPDRLARAEEPTEAAMMEIQLCRAGVTVEFSNRTAQPRQRGVNYFAENVQLLYQYTEAGEYLNLLAQRVILGQMRAAEGGYHTGGRAPYGHVRVLVDGANHVIQELVDGMKIRAQGCRVRIMPRDQDKIRIWVLILEWYCREKIGAKKIAQRLNEMEIPSPDAGRTRTDGGIKHKVSGKWGARTVLTLIRNSAIIGMQSYGAQSEGSHRRVGEKGPRLLGADDTREDGMTPKVVQNEANFIISRKTGFAPSVDENLFHACQRQLKHRGRNQRGICRRRDPARYPLAMRIWDMTEGCGHPMYARTSGDRVVYVCGRYEKTAGAECAHNSVDGDAALGFTISVLTQQIDRLGGRDALRAQLLELAAADDPPQREDVQNEIRIQKRRLAEAEVDLELIRRNFARARDDAEIGILRAELASQQKEIDCIRTQHDFLVAQSEEKPSGDPTQQIDMALELFDNLHLVVNDPAARAAIPDVMDKINLRLWLNFGEGTKGTRKVRVLQGGILTTGDTEPPVRPYGNDNDGSGPQRVCGGPGMLPVRAGVNETPSVDFISRPERVSFTMVNRGDKI
jgi:DNA invertase Pin-like site-specific DNA recombinase